MSITEYCVWSEEGGGLGRPVDQWVNPLLNWRIQLAVTLNDLVYVQCPDSGMLNTVDVSGHNKHFSEPWQLCYTGLFLMEPEVKSFIR